MFTVNAGHVVAQPRAPRDLPRRIRTHARRPRVAENHFVHVPRHPVARALSFCLSFRGPSSARISLPAFATGAYANSPGVRSARQRQPERALHRRAHRHRSQIRMREFRQHPAEFADRRPHRAHDVNSLSHISSDVSIAPRASRARHNRQAKRHKLHGFSTPRAPVFSPAIILSRALSGTYTMTTGLAGALLPCYLVALIDVCRTVVLRRL